MQFDGLQGLLKKKRKQEPTAASENAPAEVKSTPELSAAPLPASSKGANTAIADPYAAVLQRAQQQKQQQQQQQQQQQDPQNDHVDSATAAATRQQKRSREPSADADGTVVASESMTAAASTPAPADALPAPASAHTPPKKALKAAEEIRAEQERGVAALQRSREQLEHHWATKSAPPSPSNEGSASSSIVGYPTASPLPAAVASYVLSHFVSDARGGPATGEPEMALLEREGVLLSELLAEQEHSKTSGETKGQTPDVESSRTSIDPALRAEQTKLGETVRVFWYLIALRWQHALLPNFHKLPAASGAGKKGTSAVTHVANELASDQRGWSFYVYLTLQGALPADVRLTMGRTIAQEVEQWRSLTRTRQFALELLAYLYHDYHALTTQPLSTSSSATTLSAANASCIVPANLRDSLHAMLVQHLQRDRNHMAVRQEYVDVTMGTANWKLGLFSGGEVHMRRSMERVERNRIDHLLNNEHATHLLQAVREMTTFAEQQDARVMKPFYAQQ